MQAMNLKMYHKCNTDANINMGRQLPMLWVCGLSSCSILNAKLGQVIIQMFLKHIVPIDSFSELTDCIIVFPTKDNCAEQRGL